MFTLSRFAMIPECKIIEDAHTALTDEYWVIKVLHFGGFLPEYKMSRTTCFAMISAREVMKTRVCVEAGLLKHCIFRWFLNARSLRICE